MSRCWFRGCLAMGLLWGLFWPAPAAAFDLLGWLRGDRRSYTAVYLGGAGADVRTQQGPLLSPGGALFGPRYEGIPGVPSYNWGYFGAPYHPTHFCHKDYHGECLWWHTHNRWDLGQMFSLTFPR
jgi:hypothetical protein